MKYWLMKSEPSAWSWEQQVRKKVESWNGVRNYQAANNMKAMSLGDRAFFIIRWMRSGSSASSRS